VGVCGGRWSCLSARGWAIAPSFAIDFFLSFLICRYKMWYGCGSGSGSGVCYATSVDGIAWVKPELVNVLPPPYNGTNMV
jgi:hypothetical protein